MRAYAGLSFPVRGSSNQQRERGSRRSFRHARACFAAMLDARSLPALKQKLVCLLNCAFYITLSVSCTSDDDLLCSVGLVGWHEDNAMSLLASAKGLVRLAALNYWLV